MEHIQQFPKEFQKPLLLSFDLMSRLHIYFFKKSDSFFKSKWRFIFSIPGLIIHYISIILYTPSVFMEGTSASELAFSVSVFFIIIQAFLKATIVIPKKNHIAQLVQCLGEIWRTDRLNEHQLRKKEADLKKLNVGLAVFYWGSMIPAWQIMLAPAFLTLRRLYLNQDVEFLLPFGCVLPFDPVKNWFIYIGMYYFQVTSMLLVVYIYIGSEILMVTLCALLSIEFAMLREEFSQVKPVTRKYLDSEEGSDFTIEELICKHQMLIKLADHLDFIFNRMLFVDLLFVTIIMCFFGFGITVAHSALDLVNNIIAVLALLLPTFIFCYYGEQLKQESGGIAESAYNNKWYHGNASYHKIIYFVIQRSQKPSCLTSLKHAPVTLHTFSKVVSTTWSYFSLITSVYGKD